MIIKAGMKSIFHNSNSISRFLLRIIQ